MRKYKIGDRVLVGKAPAIILTDHRSIEKNGINQIHNRYLIEAINKQDELNYIIHRNVWYHTSVLVLDKQWYRDQQLNKILDDD